MFRRKAAKAAEREAHYRSAVRALDQHVYDNVLSIAYSHDATPEGRALADNDPDGFVAVYLAECDRTGTSVEEISAFFDEVREFAEDHAGEIEAERKRMHGPEL